MGKRKRAKRTRTRTRTGILSDRPDSFREMMSGHVALMTDEMEQLIILGKQRSEISLAHSIAYLRTRELVKALPVEVIDVLRKTVELFDSDDQDPWFRVARRVMDNNHRDRLGHPRNPNQENNTTGSHTTGSHT